VRLGKGELKLMPMNAANRWHRFLLLGGSLGKLEGFSESRLIAGFRLMAQTYGDLLRPQTQVLRFLSELSGKLRRSTGRMNPVVLLVLLGVLAYEWRTSSLQSLALWSLAGNMTYSLESGASSHIVFPQTGPFNERLGYTRIATFQKRLQHRGFTVTHQARFSPLLEAVAQFGVTPPYRELPLAGLRIHGADLAPLTDGATDSSFQSYAEIPKLLVKTLLFIENRELDNPPDARSNPVLEWNRLAKAVVLFTGSKIGLPVSVEGGSTLVTQLEKYRYSKEGRTRSAFDKVRQLVSATLRVYRTGVDTRPVRQEIILDYLNTMPLSAAPAHGEVNGLGEGLRVWFGESLQSACGDLKLPSTSVRKAAAYRRMLTLLAAVRAPTFYLRDNRTALEGRVLRYVGLLTRAGIIDTQLEALLVRSPVQVSSSYTSPTASFAPDRKGVNAIRHQLAQLLRIPHLYDLDRLNLEVETTLDGPLQNVVAQTFQNLKKKEFLAARGLFQQRLLERGNPANVIYGLTLFERTPEGNLLRAQVDTYEDPLDFNRGIKLELGSTAKLRTLAHYLEVVALLYEEIKSGKGPTSPDRTDAISEFVADVLAGKPDSTLGDVLRMALDRKYSGSPYETFMTGGGLHRFRNYDPAQDARRMSVREATIQSNNLAFVRLMRDLVRFHQARLDYVPSEVLAVRDGATRRRLLERAADDEARQILWRTFKQYRNQPSETVVKRLLSKRSETPRDRAILFFALEREGASVGGLSRWLESGGMKPTEMELSRWEKAYGKPSLSLLDYAYLLNVRPLSLWCAGQLLRAHSSSWNEIWERSAGARKLSSAWLFEERQRRAQNLRLRIQIERDAFARMTPAWRRLGFPYEQLVPSLASALGNAGDRPEALAELMGVILNDGELRQTIRVKTLNFGPQTPYQTRFGTARRAPVRLMNAEVARALRTVLVGVVNEGTGRRLVGAFTGPGGRAVAVGGKTGTGDNRIKAFGSSRLLLSALSASRTASFVFFIEDRYFGVLSATVLGRGAAQYGFTSALPVAILRLLAPSINTRLQAPSMLHQREDPHLYTGWPGSPRTTPTSTDSVSFLHSGTSRRSQKPNPQNSPPLDTRFNLSALPVDPSNLRWRRWAAIAP